MRRIALRHRRSRNNYSADSLVEKILLKILHLLIFSGFFFTLVGVVVYFLTPSAELVDRKVSQTSIIYDRTGEHVLYEIHGEENRKIVDHAQIPDIVRFTTLAAEDDSFYSHHGIDWAGVLRALKVNIQKSGISQGGSTITQQLAKNVFLSQERSWTRKLSEFIMAAKIEAKYSKDEILDFYLNEVPYGANAYGIESAAESYFGKSAQDLSLDEAALLSSLTKATTFFSPYGKNREALLARQQAIIQRVAELGLVKDSEAEAALQSGALDKIVPVRNSIEAPHFVFFVKEQLEAKFGKEAVEDGGFKVYTTLDWELQKMAEQVVRDGAFANEKKYNATNAALVAIDPKTGQILTMVGSRDYFDEKIDGQVNVTTRLRQPGSSFKPIIYAKAFEKGYQPETLLFDVPTSFGIDGQGKEYTPKNYNGQSSGLVSMRQALAMSLNIPAVKTMYLVGLEEGMEFAKRVGINSFLRGSDYGLSLVLGGGEISPLEGAVAFSVFANDGKKNSPQSFLKVIDAGGKTYEYAKGENEQVIDAEVARKVSSILSDNAARTPVFGSRSPLFFPNRPVAAKTGTTQENRDAWTMGYTPSLAVAVWTGNNDNVPMRAGADGIYVAAPIFKSFMEQALPRYPIETFTGYTKIESTKQMITGKIETKSSCFDVKKGKQVSKGKCGKDGVVEQKEPAEKHDILFYVNKDFPLFDYPPDLGDPMLARWEEGLKKYYNRDDDKKDKKD